MKTLKLLVNLQDDKILAKLADIDEKAHDLRLAISDFRMLLDTQAIATEESPTTENVQ